jgi:acylglycerol lipase
MSVSKPNTWSLPLVSGYTWEPQNPRATVLLQHGLGEYSERYVWQYNQLIPKLVARGFRVYAFDLPGHGDSPGTRGLVDVAQGVKIHLDARTKLPGDLPTFLIGHSLGGLVTAASVAQNPSGLSGVVLTSGAFLAKPKRWERLLSKVVTALNPEGDMPLPRPGAEALTRDQELLRVITQDDRMYHGKARNLVAATVLEVSDRLFKNLGQWQVPTLIMHGDADLSTSHQQSIRLFEALPAKDKALKIYPGGYHELLNDLEKDFVAVELFAWLESRIS